VDECHRLWSADGTWEYLLRRVQAAAGARIAPPAPVPEGGGRQRADGGGFTARIHLSADGCCRPLSLLITEGQRADCTQFEAVLGKIRVPRPAGRPGREPGRPGREPGSVAAGKAYSNSLIRRYLRRGGISHTIPGKSGSQAARRREGSRGGRPPGSGAERCK
jgi:hypothetical protein